MKLCKECGEAKPFGEFQKCTSAKDGLQLYCRSCSNTVNKKSRAARTARRHGDGCECIGCIGGVKECSRCEITKDSSEFHKLLSSSDGLQPRCKQCQRALIRYSGYRITEEIFWEMFDAQDGACATCHCGISESTAVVDHDHRCCPGERDSCGKCVRGLLCRKCNSALGFINDNIDCAISIANYLMRFEDVLILAGKGL